MILKGILFFILFPILILSAGDRFLHFLGWRRTVFASLSWGYVFILAVFQLIAYPLFRLNTSFSLLFWLFTSVVGLFIFCSLWQLAAVRKSGKQHIFATYKKELQGFCDNCKKYPFLTLILFIFIVFCLFMSLGFYYSSSDEGYNIPRALETLAQNSLGVNEVLSWRGIYTDSPPAYNNASTYYFFIAWLSYLFGIHTTILYKTFFLAVLVAIHLSAICTLYDSVNTYHSFQKKAVFLIFYILFQMLSVKPSSAGTWMTGYLYEGKATMIGVVFPLLLSACANIINNIETIKKREWLAVSTTLVAGIELSIVGVFLPVILYFCIGTAYLFGTRFHNLKKIWFPAFLAALPVVIFGLFILSSALTVFSGISGISSETVTEITSAKPSLYILFSAWKSHFLEAIDFWQFILFLAGAAYYCVYGKKSDRILFVLMPLFLFLTFLNPLFSDAVSEHITTPIVYWRLWWLLPVYFVPSIAMADSFNRLTEGKPQNALAACIILISTICGFEVFRNSIVSSEYTIMPFATNVGKLFNVRPELRSNIYNLNPGPLGIAKAIMSDWGQDSRPLVLMTFNRPFELRQYSQEIALATEVRNYDKVTGIIPGTDIEFKDFTTSYNEITDGSALKGILDILNVDYVCFNGSPAVVRLEEFGFKHICSCGGIDLWRNNR